MKRRGFIERMIAGIILLILIYGLIFVITHYLPDKIYDDLMTIAVWSIMGAALLIGLYLAWTKTGRLKWLIIGIVFAVASHESRSGYVPLCGLLLIGILYFHEDEVRRKILEDALYYEPQTALEQLHYPQDYEGKMRALANRINEELN